MGILHTDTALTVTDIPARSRAGIIGVRCAWCIKPRVIIKKVLTQHIFGTAAIAAGRSFLLARVTAGYGRASTRPTKTLRITTTASARHG